MWQHFLIIPKLPYSLSDVIEKFGEGSLSRDIAQQLAVDYCALLKGEYHTMMLCGIQSSLQDEAITAHVNSAAEKILLLFTHYTRNTISRICYYVSVDLGKPFQ